MTIETTIALNPWQAPNFATVKQRPGRRQDGISEAQGIPIAELSEDALQALAQTWLNDLYEKARFANPFTVIRGRK